MVPRNHSGLTRKKLAGYAPGTSCTVSPIKVLCLSSASTSSMFLPRSAIFGIFLLHIIVKNNFDIKKRVYINLDIKECFSSSFPPIYTHASDKKKVCQRRSLLCACTFSQSAKTKWRNRLSVFYLSFAFWLCVQLRISLPCCSRLNQKLCFICMTCRRLRS